MATPERVSRKKRAAQHRGIAEDRHQDRQGTESPEPVLDHVEQSTANAAVCLPVSMPLFHDIKMRLALSPSRARSEASATRSHNR
ncbi:hypothetical protein CCMA1212_003552 [Trichoderma ghanense]|uniref:Uncharacterized protein n=1 Tax=Trichoderma ghanense TaxID=65468 RepID=A0ABY2H6I4_9HYPO